MARTTLPYEDAQTRLFAKRELKPLPLTLDQLAEVGATETVLAVDR